MEAGLGGIPARSWSEHRARAPEETAPSREREREKPTAVGRGGGLLLGDVGGGGQARACQRVVRPSVPIALATADLDERRATWTMAALTARIDTRPTHCSASPMPSPQ